jgi:uncharacterized membrane protein YphA (DoxX/SURF4 family)
MKRIGLLLFTAIFLFGGWAQFQAPDAHAEPSNKSGLPVPSEAARATGLVMMLAAFALQFQALRRLAAILLALELIPITYVGHRFWEVEDDQGRLTQQTHFFKNVSLLGAALALGMMAD